MPLNAASGNPQAQRFMFAFILLFDSSAGWEIKHRNNRSNFLTLSGKIKLFLSSLHAAILYHIKAKRLTTNQTILRNLP